MRHFDFPQEVLSQIEHDRFEHPNRLVRRRMEALWLKAHGESHAHLAELAGMSRATPSPSRLPASSISGSSADGKILAR